MSRRRAAPKRNILPDPKFGSEKISKFINYIMQNGKKSVAERIVYESLDIVIKNKFVLNNEEIKEAFSSSPDVNNNKSNAQILSLNLALDNVSPAVEVRSRRVGGSTYQIPVEVRHSRKLALGMRWIIESAKKRAEKTMKIKLANELIDAIGGRGAAVKKREDMYKMTKANQAFAHYKW